MKIDNVYFTVTDLDKAVEFYEALLGQKITLREDNDSQSWAQFGKSDTFYFGLLCDQKVNRDRKVGNNCVLNLKSKNIDADFAKAKQLQAKIIDELQMVKGIAYDYKYFTLADPDGNLIEVARWEQEDFVIK